MLQHKAPMKRAQRRRNHGNRTDHFIVIRENWKIHRIVIGLVWHFASEVSRWRSGKNLKGHNQSGFTGEEYWSVPKVQARDGNSAIKQRWRRQPSLFRALYGWISRNFAQWCRKVCIESLTAYDAAVLWRPLTVFIAALFCLSLVRHSNQWRLIRCPVLSPAGLVY